MGSPQNIDALTYRLYFCLSCRTAVFLCSPCDRGNIYCQLCQPLANKSRLQRANQKYRSSRNGKAARARAEKQRRLRKILQMKNSVGDHGSINAHSHSNGTTAGNDAGDIPNSSREVPSDDEVAAESKSCRAVVQKQFQCEFCKLPLGIYSRRAGDTRKRAFHFRPNRKGRPP